ncbi:hypothetical protein FJZ21_03145 [Candidatus Pacearchaeota archaeon]|nr:hypothetical protein [Candidatus Pacearchaeota archaeon]
MNKLFIFSVFIFALIFVSNVYAQPTGGPSVTITVISSNSHSFGPSSPDPNKVKMEEEVRDPTASDIINGIKNKSQVSVVVPQKNGTASWSHMMRVRAVNLTTYNGTNENNETVYYNDVKIYDPADGKNYTTQLTYISSDPNKAYIYYNGWVQIRDVVIIKAHVPPKSGGLLFSKIKQFSFLLLIRSEDMYFRFSKFH